MRLGGILEREGLTDLDFHFARQHHVEKLFGRLLELLAPGDVVEQGRTGQEQRTLLRKQARRDGIRRTGSVAVADHQSARKQAVERFEERILAD